MVLLRALSLLLFRSTARRCPANSASNSCVFLVRSPRRSLSQAACVWIALVGLAAFGVGVALQVHRARLNCGSGLDSLVFRDILHCGPCAHPSEYPTCDPDAVRAIAALAPWLWTLPALAVGGPLAALALAWAAGWAAGWCRGHCCCCWDAALDTQRARREAQRRAQEPC